MILNDEERKAMDDLLRCFDRIEHEWELLHNEAELTAAVHVIQSFIIQHMLNRVCPGEWASWYGPAAQAATAK